MDRSLQAIVSRRASNKFEYCQYPLPPFLIEHIIARKHGGKTTEGNLALACIRCNFHKGPNLTGIDPQSGVVVRLFHPRRDRWKEHFRWRGAILIGATAVGRTTIEVLQINCEIRVQVRRRLTQSGLSGPSPR